MTQIGSLVVDFIAETASFNANINKAAQNLNSQTARINRSLSSIEKQARTVGNGMKALAGSVVVAELFQAGKRALDYASSLGEVSQQLGVTSRDLQLYRYAATQVGISQDEMDAGLQKLTQNIGKAALGGQAQAKAFSALGISVRNTSGDIKTAGDVIPEIAQALERVRDPAQRAAAEIALFGKAGQKLDTLLAGGKGQIENLSRAARELGIVLSDADIKSADDTADKIAELKMVLEANIARTVSQNANSIYSLVDALGRLASKLPDAIVRWRLFVNSLKQFEASSVANGAQGLSYSTFGLLGQGPMKAAQDRLKMLQAERRGIERESADRDFMAKWGYGRGNFEMPGTRPNLPSIDLPSFYASGGGGRAQRDEAGEAAKRLTEEFQKQSRELELQLRLNQMKADGMESQADIEEALFRIREQFPTLDRERLSQLEDQTVEIVRQEQAMDRMADAMRVMEGIDLTANLPGLDVVEADLERWMSRNPLPDLQTTMQKLKAMAPDAFGVITRGVEDAVLGFTSLGNAVRGVVAQLASMALQAFVFKPLAMAMGIPGFASGTNYAPGGLALVGEKGPELVNLPRGSRVTPNHRLVAMQSAMSSGLRPSNERSISFGDIHVHGARNEREARMTALQTAAVLRGELAKSARVGA